MGQWRSRRRILNQQSTEDRRPSAVAVCRWTHFSPKDIRRHRQPTLLFKHATHNWRALSFSHLCPLASFLFTTVFFVFPHCIAFPLVRFRETTSKDFLEGRNTATNRRFNSWELPTVNKDSRSMGTSAIALHGTFSILTSPNHFHQQTKAQRSTVERAVRRSASALAAALFWPQSPLHDTVGAHFHFVWSAPWHTAHRSTLSRRPFTDKFHRVIFTNSASPSPSTFLVSLPKAKPPRNYVLLAFDRDSLLFIP